MLKLVILRKDVSSVDEIQKQIGKRELTLLIKMLEVLNHSVTGTTKDAYGYRGYDFEKREGIFDEEKLLEYKTKGLMDKIQSDNRTFFLLKDNEQTICLATANLISKNARKMIVYNFVTDENLRKQGYGTTMLECLSHFAKREGYALEISLSRHSQALGNVAAYTRMAKKIGIRIEGIPASFNPDSPITPDTKEIILQVEPKLYFELDKHIHWVEGPSPSIGPRHPSTDMNPSM